MANSILQSVQLHIAGIKWVVLQFSKGKYLQYMLPGLVFSVVFWKLTNWSDSMEKTSFFDSTDGIGTYVNSTLKGSFYILGFLFKQLQVFILLTLLSPLFTWLSEKVDEDLTGKKAQIDLIQIITELFRMIGIVIISLILQGILILIYKLISGIFPLEFMDSTIAFSIAAFFYGFSFYDYSLERYQIGIFMSLSFARQKAMLNFVTGICFSCIALLPVIGLAIAPVFATMLASYVFLADNQKIKMRQTNGNGTNENV